MKKLLASNEIGLHAIEEIHMKSKEHMLPPKSKFPFLLHCQQQNRDFRSLKSDPRPKTSAGWNRGAITRVKSSKEENRVPRPSTSQSARCEDLGFTHRLQENKRINPAKTRGNSMRMIRGPQNKYSFSKSAKKDLKSEENFAIFSRKADERIIAHKQSLQRQSLIEKREAKKLREDKNSIRKEKKHLRSRKRAEAYAVNAVMKNAFERHHAALIERIKMEI